MKRVHFFVSQSETALKMRVPEEGHGRRRVQQARDRLRRSKHILVLIVNRSVHHVKAIHQKRAGGQLFQPLAIFGPKMVARPNGCGSSHGIEIVGVRQTAACFVVISANGHGVQRTHAVDHFVRIGAVSDHVSEADSFLPMALRGIQSRVESCHVRVYVAKD